METYVLAMQAKTLQWIGILALLYGLYQGYDPLFIAWRAALAAVLGMLIVGFAMRRVVRIMRDQIISEQEDAASDSAEQATA